METFDLCQRHFYGPEVNRDYGNGKGMEPILSGSV
jgi:hypothetical protein